MGLVWKVWLVGGDFSCFTLVIKGLGVLLARCIWFSLSLLVWWVIMEDGVFRDK